MKFEYYLLFASVWLHDCMCLAGGSTCTPTRVTGYVSACSRCPVSDTYEHLQNTDVMTCESRCRHLLTCYTFMMRTKSNECFLMREPCEDPTEDTDYALYQKNVDCGDPGNVSFSSRHGNDFTAPNKVTYVCFPGFATSDSLTRTCLWTGHWSGTKPVCKAELVDIPGYKGRNGDCLNNDISGMHGVVSDVEECARRCNAADDCVAYAFDVSSKNCYPKSYLCLTPTTSDAELSLVVYGLVGEKRVQHGGLYIEMSCASSRQYEPDGLIEVLNSKICATNIHENYTMCVDVTDEVQKECSNYSRCYVELVDKQSLFCSTCRPAKAKTTYVCDLGMITTGKKSFLRQLEGFYYMFEASWLTWYQARDWCAYRGMTLAAPENDSVYEWMNNMQKGYSMWRTWIGVNDLNTEGVFQRVDGTNMTYNRFNTGEPNGQTTENCVAVSTRWLDIPCSNQFSSVCNKGIEAYDHVECKPPIITNGYTNSTNASLYLGVIKVGCNPGFWRTGPDIAVCEITGSWSKLPVCKGRSQVGSTEELIMLTCANDHGFYDDVLKILYTTVNNSNCERTPSDDTCVWEIDVTPTLAALCDNKTRCFFKSSETFWELSQRVNISGVVVRYTCLYGESFLPKACPEGWADSPWGRCYLAVTSAQTWNQGHATCNYFNGYLATFETAAEHDDFSGYFQCNGTFWISLYYDSSHWQWVPRLQQDTPSAVNVSYSKWDRDQGTVNQGPVCGAMVCKEGAVWHSIGCNTTALSFCETERDAVILPEHLACSPPDIEFGFSMSAANTGYRGRVEIQCNPGYRLVGMPTGKCEITGKWSTLPKCVGPPPVRACDGDVLQISCSQYPAAAIDKIIKVLSARYGYSNETSSCGMNSTTCYSNVTRELMDECNNNTYCNVYVDASKFNSNCISLNASLEVKYVCLPGEAYLPKCSQTMIASRDGRSCYSVYRSERLNRTLAQEKCQAFYNGHLATFSNEDDLAACADILQQSVWIGLYREGGNFKWWPDTTSPFIPPVNLPEPAPCVLMRADLILETSSCANLNAPLCELQPENQITCANPVIDNGSVTLKPSSATDGRYTYRQRVNFRCFYGYELTGLRWAVCQITGTWSTIPRCIIIDCKQPPSDGLNVTYNATTFGSLAEYRCPLKTKMFGTKYAKCQADGTWSEPGLCVYRQRICQNDIAVLNCSTGAESPIDRTINVVFAIYGRQKAHVCPTQTENDNNTCTFEVTGVIKNLCDSKSLCYYFLQPQMFPAGCQNSSSYLQFYFKCLPVAVNDTSDIQCPMPTIPNSKLDTNESFASYRHQVGVSCDPGYKLRGLPFGNCEITGNWSTLPTCDILDCGQVPAMPYANTTATNTTAFGSKVNYACLEGYTPTGAELVCTANGTWSESPLCQMTDCQQPPSRSNLNLISGHNVTTYGSTVAYSCGAGFKYENGSSTCLASGKWSTDQLPQCVTRVRYACQGELMSMKCSQVGLSDYDLLIDVVSALFGGNNTAHCENPTQTSFNNSCSSDATDAIKDACQNMTQCSVRASSDALNSTCVSTGSSLEVHYKCTPIMTDGQEPCVFPFIFNGTNVTRCLLTNIGEDVYGPWCAVTNNYDVDNLRGTCLLEHAVDITKINCSLPVIRNSNSSSEVTFGYRESSLITCKTGYELDGPSIVYCMVTGEVSTLPQCRAIECASPPNPENARVDYTSVTYLSVANYSCPDNFQLSGSSQATCLATGNWTDAPFCTEKTCEVPVVENGLVNWTEPLLHGQSIEVKCIDKYHLIGSEIITCNVSQAEWFDLPVCRRRTEAHQNAMLVLNCSSESPVEVDGLISVNKATHISLSNSTTSSSTCSVNVTGYLKRNCDSKTLCVIPVDSVDVPDNSLCKGSTLRVAAEFSCNEAPKLTFTLQGEMRIQGTCVEGLLNRSTKVYQEFSSRFNLELSKALTDGHSVEIQEIRCRDVIVVVYNVTFNESVDANKVTDMLQRNIVTVNETSYLGSLKLLDNQTALVPVGEATSSCAPPSIPNGYTNRTTISKYRDVTHFICDRGYDMMGLSYAVCEITGKWSTLPSCTPGKTCVAPVIGNGLVDLSEPLFHGDIIQVQCKDKYHLIGSAKITCNVSQADWLDLPVCRRKTEAQQNTMLVLNCSSESPLEVDGLISVDKATHISLSNSTTSSSTCSADLTGYLRRNCDSKTLCVIPVDSVDVPDNSLCKGSTLHVAAEFSCNEAPKLTFKLQGEMRIPGTCDEELRNRSSKLYQDFSSRFILELGKVLPDGHSVEIQELTCRDVIVVVYNVTFNESVDANKVTEMVQRNIVTVNETSYLGSLKLLDNQTALLPVGEATSSCAPPSIPNGYTNRTTLSIYRDVTHFTCDRGYDMIGLSYAVCEITGKWSTLPSCTPGKTCIVPVIENGLVDLSEPLLHGENVQVECKDRHILIGSATITCNVSQADWLDLPVCRLKAEAQQNTMLFLNCSSESPDEVDQIISVDKATLISWNNSTNSSSTCTADVTTYLRNNCDSKSLCVIPVDSIDVPFNSSCKGPASYVAAEFSCNEAPKLKFKLQGEMRIEGNCVDELQNRSSEEYGYISSRFISEMSKVLPDGHLVEIQEFRCGSIIVIYIIISNESMDANKVTEMVRSHIVRVNETSYFGSLKLLDNQTALLPVDEVTPTCTPPSVANGKTNTTLTSNYRDVKHFTCDRGYDLVGLSYAVCEITGEWSTLPLCTLVDCGDPPEVENTTISYVSTTYNSKANYACSDSFDVLRGSPVTFCQANGTWMTPTVNCSSTSSINCGHPPQTHDSHPTFTSTDYQAKAVYTCLRDGDVIEGGGISICQADGEWTPVPSCQRGRPKELPPYEPTYEPCTKRITPVANTIQRSAEVEITTNVVNGSHVSHLKCSINETVVLHLRVIYGCAIADPEREFMWWDYFCIRRPRRVRPPVVRPVFTRPKRLPVEAPYATAIGGSQLFIVVALLGLIVGFDLTTLGNSVRLMRRNLGHLKSNKLKTSRGNKQHSSRTRRIGRKVTQRRRQRSKVVASKRQQKQSLMKREAWSRDGENALHKDKQQPRPSSMSGKEHLRACNWSIASDDYERTSGQKALGRKEPQLQIKSIRCEVAGEREIEIGKKLVKQFPNPSASPVYFLAPNRKINKKIYVA